MRCGGCVASITQALKKEHSLNTINIDIDSGVVEFDSDSQEVYQAVIQTLLNLGYPKRGTTKGWGKTKAQTKSIISCATGKFK